MQYTNPGPLVEYLAHQLVGEGGGGQQQAKQRLGSEHRRVVVWTQLRSKCVDDLRHGILRKESMLAFSGSRNEGKDRPMVRLDYC